MAIAPELSAALDKAGPADPLQVVFTLKPSVVAPVPAAGAGLDIGARRAAFASAVDEAMAAALGKASSDSGHSPADKTIFSNMASAWLRAPAGFVSALAANPDVASIALDKNGGPSS